MWSWVDCPVATMRQSDCALLSITSGTSRHRCATSGFVFRDTDQLLRGTLQRAATKRSVMCSVLPSAPTAPTPDGSRQAALLSISLIDAKTARPLHGAEVCLGACPLPTTPRLALAANGYLPRGTACTHRTAPRMRRHGKCPTAWHGIGSQVGLFRLGDPVALARSYEGNATVQLLATDYNLQARARLCVKGSHPPNAFGTPSARAVSREPCCDGYGRRGLTAQL